MVAFVSAGLYTNITNYILKTSLENVGYFSCQLTIKIGIKEAPNCVQELIYPHTTCLEFTVYSYT